MQGIRGTGYAGEEACSQHGRCLMRGRTPRPLAVPRKDQEVLQQIARSDSLPWYQVRRARIVLALAAGERVHSIAGRLECDQATVWRTRQLYSQLGLAGLLADG